MRCACTRALPSMPPPGENGTIRVSGRVGQSWAAAPPAANAHATTIADHTSHAVESKPTAARSNAIGATRPKIGVAKPCCGPVNRGVAVYGGRVYEGTLDGRLVALDARTGRRAWTVRVADNERAYAVDGAPVAADGKIIVGISGAEYGIRGFVSAYDAGAQRVSYARLVDGMNMGLVDVSCEAADGGTQVTVRYTLTPLSEAGQHNIAHLLDAQHYAAFMEEWRAAITAALRRDDEAD